MLLCLAGLRRAPSYGPPLKASSYCPLGLQNRVNFAFFFLFFLVDFFLLLLSSLLFLRQERNSLLFPLLWVLLVLGEPSGNAPSKHTTQPLLYSLGFGGGGGGCRAPLNPLLPGPLPSLPLPNAASGFSPSPRPPARLPLSSRVSAVICRLSLVLLNSAQQRGSAGGIC